MYSILFVFLTNLKRITGCEWLEALCHVLFHPIYLHPYITTECTELIELRCNDVYGWVWAFSRSKWRAEQQSVGGRRTVWVDQLACFFNWFQLGCWSCGQQEEVNIAGSCFCMKNFLSMFGEKQSDGLLLNKIAVTNRPRSLKSILIRGGHHLRDEWWTFTSSNGKSNQSMLMLWRVLWTYRCLFDLILGIYSQSGVSVDIHA